MLSSDACFGGIIVRELASAIRYCACTILVVVHTLLEFNLFAVENKEEER